MDWGGSLDGAGHHRVWDDIILFGGWVSCNVLVNGIPTIEGVWKLVFANCHAHGFWWDKHGVSCVQGFGSHLLWVNGQRGQWRGQDVVWDCQLHLWYGE